MRSWRSMSPTERSDVASKLRMARRFGSAMIANEDSTPRIYPPVHIPGKPYSTAERAAIDRAPDAARCAGLSGRPVGEDAQHRRTLCVMGDGDDQELAIAIA